MNQIDIDEAIKILEEAGLEEFINPEYHPIEAPTIHFIWLAVDSNGNEKMTTCEAGFQRFSPRLYHSNKSIDPKIGNAAWEERKKICSYEDTQMKDDHWIEIPRKEDMGKFGAYPQWAYLPKGTIKKLIGRELTWNDEPVKYEG